MFYDYECQNCENIQEEKHPMSGPYHQIICRKCGSKSMKKVISAPYVKFVGADWDTNQNRGIQ